MSALSNTPKHACPSLPPTVANQFSLTPHSSSFGDPNAHPPPTPKQTPTSGAFPSPIFETPKPPQGSFADTSGLTPRFAEEYSVFNATPGNLRGAQFPFADFVPTTPFASAFLGHKRQLSADEHAVERLAIEIATRANIPPSNPNLPPPPVDPSRRLPSSPAALISSTKAAVHSEAQLGPAFSSSSHTKSPKKLRRGTIEGSDAAQPLSPPPSAHKSDQKLAPKINMQDDQSYGHPDFGDGFQGMAGMMGGAEDMFVYPMSAPPGQANFWDPAMGMDLDFSTAGAAFFQPSHRHTGSFDWNSDIQLFQDPVPPPPPPSSNQENVQPNAQHINQPARRERMLAPKPPISTGQTAAPMTASAMFPTSMEDSFGLATPMEGVDPGLLYSRPPTSSMTAEFNHINTSSADMMPIAEASGNSRVMAQPRRTNSMKETKRGKMPDRSYTSSPVKAMSRPELNRSLSETRSKKAMGRGALPTLASTSRPSSQTSSMSVNTDVGKSGSQLSRSGRMSPLKSQRRLSSLASIPEFASQPQLHRPRTSVKFTIDAHGRARAETTVVVEDSGSITRSRSSRELSSTRRSWESSDDESSTDEEPIIIPSRANSFNASFALPDPRKPVGSIFHSGRRSISDRSRSASTPSLVTPIDGESEAETIMTDHHERGGDAASELRKVVEDRQKRSIQENTRSHQRILTSSGSGNYKNSAISPVSMADSNYRTEGHRIRCVCSINEPDEDNGYMLQCESCEMWLHGKCVNISRRTMPSVYICGYCANTPNVAARRAQQNIGRGGSGGQLASSSLQSKTLRTLR
ncbi:hypothetical protein MKX08_009827 [Trichoderma sp. CBMAI-0020]|nr:hypothetical protein MKX08_009827 [Trichoderma sp. CBMAI-0020]